MPKALADSKTKFLKEATKKAASKGITKPRHKPLTSQTPPLAPVSAFPDNPYHSKSVEKRISAQTDQGIDTSSGAVVHSGHVAKQGDAFNHLAGALMNQPTETQKPQAQIDKEAAAKAKIEAKAAKQAEAAKKAAERAEAKAAKETEAKAAKEVKDKAAAEKKAKVEAEKKARAEARAQRTPRDPNAVMATLGERTKAGVYVKGANGQLRSNDEVAIALESIPATKMVPFLLKFMALETNPYAGLNYGQQSMNLRNKLRGMVKAGCRVVTPAVKAVAEKKEGDKIVQPAVAAVPAVTTPVTIELLKAARDEGNWTHDEAKAAAEAAKAAKAEAKKEPVPA